MTVAFVRSYDQLALLREVRREGRQSAKRISSLDAARRAQQDLPSCEHAGLQPGRKTQAICRSEQEPLAVVLGRLPRLQVRLAVGDR